MIEWFFETSSSSRNIVKSRIAFSKVKPNSEILKQRNHCWGSYFFISSSTNLHSHHNFVFTGVVFSPKCNFKQRGWNQSYVIHLPHPPIFLVVGGGDGSGPLMTGQRGMCGGKDLCCFLWLSKEGNSISGLIYVSTPRISTTTTTATKENPSHNTTGISA